MSTYSICGSDGMARARVAVIPIDEDIKDAVRRCFEEFGGVERFIKGDVFIKVNVLAPYRSLSNTSPEVIAAVIDVLRDGGAKKIYVMENTSAGLFTRLVFKAQGLDKMIREHGATPLYLDEEPAVMVNINGEVLRKIPFPRIVYERLVREKEKNTYIVLPRLKTHVLTKITCGIKLQHGLVYDDEKIYAHDRIDEKLVDILSFIKPDFAIVDCTESVHGGPLPPPPKEKEWSFTIGVLLAGDDVVAVDAVAAQLLGFTPRDVKHVWLAHEKGLGCADLNEIEIIGDLQRFVKKGRLDVFEEIKLPDYLKVIRGGKICPTGCPAYEAVLRGVYATAGAKRGFTLIYGGDVPKDKLTDVVEPVVLAGKCAMEELRDFFAGRRVIEIPECYNQYMAFKLFPRLMGVRWKFLRVISGGLGKALVHLLTSKVRGVRARVAM